MKNELNFTDVKIIKLGVMMLLVILATMMTKPVNAYGVYQLDVNYTQGSVASGPLSFGLNELPTTVAATFMLGAGTVGRNSSVQFNASDVVSANVTFGDTIWTGSLLDTFSMSLSLIGGGTNVTSLNYAFSPISSPTGNNIIILNFPLSITGTDIATGQTFEYEYAQSSQIVSTAVVPIPAAAWLFASGLLGLIGIARHKEA